jgi:hypothetical protein
LFFSSLGEGFPPVEEENLQDIMPHLCGGKAGCFDIDLKNNGLVVVCALVFRRNDE